MSVCASVVSCIVGVVNRRQQNCRQKPAPGVMSSQAVSLSLAVGAVIPFAHAGTSAAKHVVPVPLQGRGPMPPDQRNKRKQ